jgi:hypothetical protein
VRLLETEATADEVEDEVAAALGVEDAWRVL